MSNSLKNLFLIIICIFNSFSDGTRNLNGKNPVIQGKYSFCLTNPEIFTSSESIANYCSQNPSACPGWKTVILCF